MHIHIEKRITQGDHWTYRRYEYKTLDEDLETAKLNKPLCSFFMLGVSNHYTDKYLKF